MNRTYLNIILKNEKKKNILDICLISMQGNCWTFDQDYIATNVKEDVELKIIRIRFNFLKVIVLFTFEVLLHTKIK